MMFRPARHPVGGGEVGLDRVKHWRAKDSTAAGRATVPGRTSRPSSVSSLQYYSSSVSSLL